MSDLQFNQNSPAVIELSSPNLVFNLNPSANPDTAGIYGKSDFTMNVRNISNNYVVIRTKTTKKEVYAVNPTYGMISPLGSIDIKFVYYIKDLNEDPRKHKFKFEGVLVEKAIPEKDVKGLFDYYISNRVVVNGNAIKAEVVFNRVEQPQEEIRISNAKSSLPKQNLTASNNYQKVESTPNSQSTPNFNEVPAERSDSPQFKSINVSQPQKPIIQDKQAEQTIQEMKVEYQKYKNQLTSLVDTHRTLKNRVEMERTKDSSFSPSTNITITSSSDEKQIPKQIALVIIICSVLFGFILSR